MVGESISQEADRLRRERRAKMQEIKENMANNLWNRDTGESFVRKRALLVKLSLIHI